MRTCPGDNGRVPKRGVKPGVQRKRSPHVALLVETSLGSGRDILRGIARYVREHPGWSLIHEPRSLEESIPEWLADWEGDGIIARIQNPAIAQAVIKTQLPVVDVLGLVPDLGIPLVHVDDREIARLAAEHLLERGFRQFGYLGLKAENWSVRREQHFRECVIRAGCSVLTYEQTRHVQNLSAWEQEEDSLAAWIARLPKPAGVMVCSDQRGLYFLEACRRAGVAVPDEVAVIGVDNDDALCEIAYPPLSSVWPAHAHVGYEAASLLDQLMARKRPRTQSVLIAPSGVVTRQSTDVLAVEDLNIAKAVRLIREQSCEGLKVDEVARYAGLSRSVLQRRFRRFLGKSVHAAILDARLKRACQLILETSMNLIDISEASGFKHQEYMGAVFKARLGKTPAQFRRQGGQGLGSHHSFKPRELIPGSTTLEPR
jgi:LacI family transcriptional regulator